MIRLQNRFASGAVETVGVERLLSEFYVAETVGSGVGQDGKRPGGGYTKEWSE